MEIGEWCQIGRTGREERRRAWWSAAGAEGLFSCEDNEV